MRASLLVALLALLALAAVAVAQHEQSAAAAQEFDAFWQQPSFVESLAEQEIDVRSLSPEQFQSMLRERNPLWMHLEAERHTAMLELDTELDEAAAADSEVDAEAEVEAEVDAQLLADLEVELDDTADAELDSETEAEAEAEHEDRALVESHASGPVGAGRTAGASGKVAGASGKVAGASGKVAGASGKVAGASGKVGGASGKVGGASGKVGGASGKVSGASGKVGGDADRHNPTVVQPLVTSKVQLSPYPGNPYANGYPKDKHECWYLYNMYHRRYGVQTDMKVFDKNPLALCTGNWPKDADRQRLVKTYKELMSRPAGSPFVNRHVATKPSSVSAQLQCGSCWAQAATGSFEVALKKAGKFKADLSVQQLVDCVKGAAFPDSHGCKGGTPMDGLKYLRTHGHATEKAYPYTGKEGTCRESLGASGPKSNGWVQLSFDAATVAATKHNYAPCSKANCDNQWMYEMDVVFAIKNDGPFIAWVDASQWQHYTGGIFDATKYCKSTTEAGNHIVELLGYGRQNGIPYWLVKNSWGNSWGENGFIKLPMGMNACGVFNYVGRAKP